MNRESDRAKERSARTRSLATISSSAPEPSTLPPPPSPPAPALSRTVADAVRGDSAARAALHAMFRPVVHGIALAHVGPADADDVTQEVFVRVLQALPTLRDPAAFPGWIAGTARNAALDALRRRTRRPAAEPLPDDLPSPRADAPEPDADQAADAVRRRVLAALARVPDTYRETLYLRFAEGLTGLEIAERTGRSPGALRVHLCRGTALLRQELRRDAR